MVQNIRSLPRHVIVARMRRARITQLDVALELGVSQTYVFRVIARQAAPSPATERVWRALECALGGR